MSDTSDRITGTPRTAAAEIDDVTISPSGHMIVTMSDGRVLDAGQIASQGNVQIPNVYVYADSLTGWVDKKDERLGTLEYRSPSVSFNAAVKIKPQGTSSLAYAKKNFTITLYEDETFAAKKKQTVKAAWGAQSKYVMKADWIDPTHACNVVSAQLAGKMNAGYGIFPDAPNSGCIDGFPVLLHLNDDLVGLYNFTIPKDGWMCGFTDDSVAMIVSAEVQDGAGAFRAEADWDSWSSEYGADDEEALAAFNRLVNFVKDASDANFRAHISEYLNLDATLNYFIFAYLSGAVDNLGKNMLMATPDRVIWTPVLYDLDSLWGVSYDGIQTIEFDHACPGWYQCNNSLLWEKLMRCFPGELALRHAALRADALSTGTITAAFETYMYGIQKRLYDLDKARWPDLSSMGRTLDGMRTWLFARAQYTDFQLYNMRTTPSTDLGRVLYELEEPWVGDGAGSTGSVLNTGVKLFDNPHRDWTLVLRMSNDNLTDGYRVILSCMNGDQHGLQIKRELTTSNETYISMGQAQVIRCPAVLTAQSVFVVVKNRNNYYVYRDGVYMGGINRSAISAAWSGPIYLGGSGNEAGTETWWGTTPMTVAGVKLYQEALASVDAIAVSAAT